jgi:hypothetical protein
MVVITRQDPDGEVNLCFVARIRLMEHTAFVEQGEEPAYQKHFFVHIGNSLSYTDPLLEVWITEEEST